MIRILQLILIILLTSQITGFVEGSDWTKWRGPFSNGTTDETDWNPKSLDHPKIVWQTEVGKGHASITVKEDRLYTMGNRKRCIGSDTVYYDIVYCKDAISGETIWTHEYRCDPLCQLWACVTQRCGCQTLPQVSVHVDEPGCHVEAVNIYHLLGRCRRQIADCDNAVTSDRYVGIPPRIARTVEESPSEDKRFVLCFCRGRYH